MAVIETISLRLAEGASTAAFASANSKVEAEYLPAQPGFNPGTRATTLADDGTWTISLRWDSASDAEASMASFMDAPATQDFLALHEWGGTNPGGHDQVDGSTEITDLHLTEANKEVVRRLLTEAFAEEPTAPMADFISSETYINHNPDAPDGLDALIEMDRSARAAGQALFYKKVYRVVGQGNFVVSFAHQVWNSIDYAAFDIFRLENGKIVEHWDNVETLPPTEELVNSGKF